MSFVGRMVEESCEMGVRQRCLWFTSMLGKHASERAYSTSLSASSSCTTSGASSTVSTLSLDAMTANSFD